MQQELVTQPARVLDRVVQPLVEQRAERVPGRSQVVGQGGTLGGVVAGDVPGSEQVVDQVQRPLPERAGFATTVDQRLKVPREMRPAELALPIGEPAVGRPPVADHVAPDVLA